MRNISLRATLINLLCFAEGCEDADLVNCSDNSFFLPWEGLAQVHPMITLQWSHFDCCVVRW